MNLQGRSFIGCQRGQGTQVIEGVGRDPRTGAVLTPAFLATTPEELELAGSLAAKAFPVYSAMSASKRAAFLRKIAANIESLGAEIEERMVAETGLPVGRVQGERGRTCGQLRMFADLIEQGSWVDARIDTADAARKPLPKVDIRSMWRPIGPVAVFCAGNFPLAYSVGGGDTASALAAGNPVVVNAHIGHPGVAELIGGAIFEAAQSCGMPEGVFSLVYGPGIEVGQALAKHPAIRAIGFTGSHRGGRALMDIAAARPNPIPVYAEMSSVNPVIILPEAGKERAEQIAETLHGAVTLGAGQFCTSPGLIFVSEGEGQEPLIASLVQRFSNSAAGVMLNEGIAKNYSQGVANLKSHPATKLLAEGAEDPAIFAPARAALFSTTDAELIKNEKLQAEVFGPCALIVRYSSPLPETLGALQGQLTATIHASDSETSAAQSLMDSLTQLAGRVIINGVPTGVEVCPSIVHGGPYPATSDGRTSSVGTSAIYRFCRRISYQACPDAMLPQELQRTNPLGIVRLVNSISSQELA